MSSTIILTSINDNNNEVLEFKSKTDATKYINKITDKQYDRKTIYKYIDKNIPFENFIISTKDDPNKDNYNEYLFYEFKADNDFNNIKIRITTKLPRRVSIYDIISILFTNSNKKYNEIINLFPDDCNIYKFKGGDETCVVNAKSLITIINSFDENETINIFRNTCLNDLINFLEPIIVNTNEPINDKSCIIKKRKKFIEFIYNDYNERSIKITNNDPKQICIYDVLSIMYNTNNPHIKYEKLIKKYPEIETLCEKYTFVGKGQSETLITDATSFKKIVDLLSTRLVDKFKKKHINYLIKFLNTNENNIKNVNDKNIINNTDNIKIDDNNNMNIVKNLDDIKDNNIIITNNINTINANNNVIIKDLDDTEDKNIINKKQFIVNKNENIMEFMFNGNDEFNGKKLRVTNEILKRVSIFDLISVVCNVNNPRDKYNELIKNYPEVVEISYNLKFEGSGQRKTPVTDAKGIITIINLLSGPLAAKFRNSCSEILVRFLGGDLTLIDQIKINNDIQQQLPDNNPIKIFSEAINNKIITEKKRIDYELKSPNMIGKSISDFKDRYIVYLIQFFLNNRNYLKFGISDKSINRVEFHLKSLPNSLLWCMIETKDNKKIEDELKVNMKHKNKLINLIINNNNQTEILENIDPIHVEEHIYKLIKDIENGDYVKLQLAYIELEKYKLDNEKELKFKELENQKYEYDKELKLKEYDNQIKLKELEIKMKLFDNIDKLTPEILKYLMH